MTSYTELVSKTRKVFLSGRTKDLKWRKKQLEGILHLIDENREAIELVLKNDLRKHKNEATVMEIDFVRNEVILCLNEIDEWVKPQKVKKNLLTMMDECFIHAEPFGVALVIGAWNYPFQLTMAPVLGALVAGNCVILKPSEVSVNTARLLENLFPIYFDTECVHVVNGGVPETTELLTEKFDFIFYTGNNVVAKIVYEAAAKHLTPVVLELGGKSPAYVDATSDLDIVARRILWGKFANTGQTCIAPDYIMCPQSVQAPLVEKLRTHLKKFYGEDPERSDSYGRMVNNKHFHRVKELMKNGQVVIGGEMNEKDNYIAPTVMVDVKPSDPIMKEEIFGPVLPMMTVGNEDEAIEFIKTRDKPLAMYVFTKDKSVIKKFVNKTSSGGLTVNDVLLHASLPSLPFGGIGPSGMGKYHGKFSFDAFSHPRAVMIKKQSMEVLNNIRVPPYTEKKLGYINMVLRQSPNKGRGLRRFFPFILLFGVLAFFLRAIGVEKYLPKFK